MKNYQLEKAFLLGFMVSRQGFNGECAYGHLAHELAHDCSIADFEEKMKDNRAFVALQKQAMEILEKEHHCKLEQLNSELIAALSLISNDGRGCFKDWEDAEGNPIQKVLERPLKEAKKI